MLVFYPDQVEPVESSANSGDVSKLNVIPTPTDASGDEPGAVACVIRPQLLNVSFDLNQAGKEIRVPRSLQEVRQQLHHLADGWPKVATGRLCFRQEDPLTGRQVPAYIETSAGLFSWMDEHAAVCWFASPGCCTKEEFLEHLRRRCDGYTWATDLPHWPPLPGVLYTNKTPKPKDTGRLDQFVQMFDVQTPLDELLVKAFVLTAFWGGPPGKRPLFVFAAADGTSDSGRGSGKSTIAQAVGRIAGGCQSIQRESGSDRVLTDLLSPSGLAKRIVLLDNVKSLKFSSSFLEGLITAHEVDGHQMYIGHGSRPNVLTYVITANEPMLSKDLATRAVTILLNQAKKDPTWDAKLDKMLTDQKFLKKLYQDILWHLQQPVKVAGNDPSQPAVKLEHDRWALWWHEVVSRICPDVKVLAALLALVKGRRGQVDADLADREQVEEAIMSFLYGAKIPCPEAAAVFFPAKVLKLALGSVFGNHATVIDVSRRVKGMQCPHLYYTQQGPPNDKANGYWWVGPDWHLWSLLKPVHAFREDHQVSGGYTVDSCGHNAAKVMKLVTGNSHTQAVQAGQAAVAATPTPAPPSETSQAEPTTPVIDPVQPGAVELGGQTHGVTADPAIQVSEIAPETSSEQ
jgi:hypothetical protein